MIEEMQAKREQKKAEQVNAIRNAAEIASKIDDPTAKAIGEGIKLADKLTDGKATEMMAKANKFAPPVVPGFKMPQKLATKVLGNPKTGDRIVNAMNAKNNPTSSAANLKQMASKKGAPNNLNTGSESTPTNKKETEEQTSDGGLSNFDLSYKVIKVGLIAMIPVTFLVVIICLFTTSANIFINAIGLDAADSTSSSEADEKIGKIKDEDANKEVTDETAYDIYISDEKSEKLRNSKLKRYIQINNDGYVKRKYREVDLDNLHDFYPEIKRLENEHNTSLVYDFYYKMYNLNERYQTKYGVNLDLPLLMSTLRLQSTEMDEVFAANLAPDDRKKTKKYMPEEADKNEYDYYYDWSNYKVSKDNSVHDMEILAQRMVVSYENTSENTCQKPVNNMCYKVDSEKYKEFLHEFLEKKYFVEGESSLSQNETGQVPDNSKTSTMAEVMVNIANQEYLSNSGKKGGKKYWSAAGYNGRIEWCVTFAWYVSSQTVHEGIRLYPDVIDYKTASTGAYMKYFNTSPKPNINFYYNDSCSKLKGKNGNVNYTPKPGDYIFFDWQKKFNDINQSGPGTGPQDHTGLVEKYEDGVVYTIEGNISDTLIKRSFKIDDCKIIGFGSWY